MNVIGTVQQHSMMISVSHAARKFGIKRGMNPSQCLSLCPNVLIFKVETTPQGKVSLERYRIASEYSIFIGICFFYA